MTYLHSMKTHLRHKNLLLERLVENWYSSNADVSKSEKSAVFLRYLCCFFLCYVIFKAHFSCLVFIFGTQHGLVSEMC